MCKLQSKRVLSNRLLSDDGVHVELGEAEAVADAEPGGYPAGDTGTPDKSHLVSLLSKLTKIRKSRDQCYEI
jgi:hypothetical protein